MGDRLLLYPFLASKCGLFCTFCMKAYLNIDTPHSQPFWGNMVAAAGAGPNPIPQKRLTSGNLADAISFCLTPEASIAAAKIAKQMRAESGVKAAVKSFHDNLPVKELQCDLIPSQAAAWRYQNGKREWKLSKLAAGVLAEGGKLDAPSLEL